MNPSTEVVRAHLQYLLSSYQRSSYFIFCGVKFIGYTFIHKKEIVSGSLTRTNNDCHKILPTLKGIQKSAESPNAQFISGTPSTYTKGKIYLNDIIFSLDDILINELVSEYGDRCFPIGLDYLKNRANRMDFRSNNPIEEAIKELEIDGATGEEKIAHFCALCILFSSKDSYILKKRS